MAQLPTVILVAKTLTLTFFFFLFFHFEGRFGYGIVGVNEYFTSEKCHRADRGPCLTRSHFTEASAMKNP